MEDDSILLVRDGEVVWSLEEALTSIVQTKFINLPLQLAGEKNRLEAKAVARDIKTVTLSERLTAQVGDVSMLFSSFSEFFSKVYNEHSNFLPLVMLEIQHVFTAAPQHLFLPPSACVCRAQNPLLTSTKPSASTKLLLCSQKRANCSRCTQTVVQLRGAISWAQGDGDAL